jgi:hypothetical protein
MRALCGPRAIRAGARRGPTLDQPRRDNCPAEEIGDASPLMHDPNGTWTVQCDWRPGCIGRIVELHARYCTRRAGFSAAFDSKVARELALTSARTCARCRAASFRRPSCVAPRGTALAAR